MWFMCRVKNKTWDPESTLPFQVLTKKYKTT